MARMLNNPWIEKAVMAAPNAAVQPHYVQVLDLCARQDGAQNCVLSDGARSIGAVLDASCVAAFEQTNVLERLQGGTDSISRERKAPACMTPPATASLPCLQAP